GQPVGRVVGDAAGLLLRVKRDHRHDRAEDLLAGDPRPVVHVVENRRLDKEAALRTLRERLRAATAEGELRLPAADLEVRHHLVILLLTDQRSDRKSTRLNSSHVEISYA